MSDIEVLYREMGQSCSDDPVTVARLLVLGGAQVRLLVRFYNRSRKFVTGLRIAIRRLDEDGDSQICREFEFCGLFAKPDTEFPVPDLYLPAKWRKVCVEVLAVQMTDREYDCGDGTVHYVGLTARKHIKEQNEERSPLKKYALILSLLIAFLVLLPLWFCFGERVQSEELDARFGITAVAGEERYAEI